MATQADKVKIRILTVDDHAILREGIAAIIQLQPDMVMVGEATNGTEALELFRQLRPDVTLMDLQMPGMDGLTAIEAIRAQNPKARIIVLTTYAGDMTALKALKAGAMGYLLKSSLRKDLLDTIRLVHSGRKMIPPEIANEIALHAADDQLSDREIAILNLVAEGCSNKEIAARFSLSEETIKAHMKSVFAKLGVANRTQAAIVAAKRGFLGL
jgi:DNA-binding NarL/FixJ family response regulator